jgi:GntR family transcriptional regulator, galactonate operon transcriptional repressor
VTRLHREAAEVLLDSIVKGRYAAGALLPKETALVEEFDISRGTVREALRALEERGVVRVTHGRGARVQPPEEWNVLDPVVARAMAGGRGRRDFLREVGLYRLILESEAAALAAERASDRQRAELRVRAADLDGDDPLRSAQRVRRLVAVASRNRPLAATLRALDQSIEPRLGAGDVPVCGRLALAVADGDPDAARAAARELNRAG